MTLLPTLTDSELCKTLTNKKDLDFNSHPNVTHLLNAHAEQYDFFLLLFSPADFHTATTDLCI